MMKIAEAFAIAGPPSRPSKMPWLAYDLPTTDCRMGGRLTGVKGSECTTCYARTGNYLRPKTLKRMRAHLASLQDPRWVEAMATIIEVRAATVPPERRFFRWHSSGDVQNLDHLRKIVEIAERLPGVRFWLQTKELDDVRSYLREHGQFPSNLTVRMSSAFIGKPDTRLGLPATFIIPAGEAPPTAAVECSATRPGSDGKCGSCRACWDASIHLIGYHHHGKSARRAVPQFGLPMAAGVTITMSEHETAPSITQPTGETGGDGETRVSPARSGKLSKEEASAIDERILLALDQNKRDEVMRRLSIARDVAAITRDRNFEVLGFASREKYFKSRCESKPYGLALEIIGNSDVDSIQAMVSEHGLTWKRLQIYTTVEKDPALLPCFIERTVAYVKNLPVREFHESLKEIKDPSRYGPKAQAAKTGPAATSVAPAAIRAGDCVTAPANLGITWEEVADAFERGLHHLLESRTADCAEALAALVARVQAAIEGATEALGIVPESQTGGEVVQFVPVPPATDTKAS